MVHNVAELELLLMHNRKYAAEVAHNVSALKVQEGEEAEAAEGEARGTPL